ncbi:MAG: Glu/Leu/Phe/Val dehydrogenase, partial [Clostridiales bacterium]|nr:Glu/Leu/Phe/Val dehydrogenase [Clostridiales bacterium]
YSMMHGYSVPGVVTRKPFEIGGSLGRPEATGRGVMFMTREILNRLDMDMTKTRVAVQGMGNVGSVAALLISRAGGKIVAVSDVSGGLYNENGLDIEKIYEHVKQRKYLTDLDIQDAKRITNEELLTCDCDVLIPAALENQLSAKNANDVKAKIIVEGANGPTTNEADEIFEKRGIVLVPDILANAGGVIVSYFEWVQNIQSLTWDEEEINNKLEKIIIKAFNDVWNESKQYNTTLRMGANMVALDRIVKAKKVRGIFP